MFVGEMKLMNYAEMRFIIYTYNAHGINMEKIISSLK